MCRISVVTTLYPLGPQVKPIFRTEVQSSIIMRTFERVQRTLVRNVMEVCDLISCPNSATSDYLDRVTNVSGMK